MDKFEYRTHEFKKIGLGGGAFSKSINEDLNTLGEDGWEVVSANPMSMINGTTTSIIIILKRKIIS